MDLNCAKRDRDTLAKMYYILACCWLVNLDGSIKLLKGLNLRFSCCRYSCSSSIWYNAIEDVCWVSVIKGECRALLWLVENIWFCDKIEHRLVIKNSDGLCAIYFVILSEVLVKRVVFNFHIYKELFSFINLTLEIFYAFILN